MKKILMRVSTMLSVAALLVGLTVVSSCNDTKDDAKKDEVKELPNCFSVADTTINLVSGKQEFYGAEGGPFGDNNDIYIVLEGKKDNAGGSTRGSKIGLEFCIDKADTALVAGIYPFSGTESYPVGTFVPYEPYYSIVMEDGENWEDIVSGEAVVKLSGEIYEITFVGKDPSDKEIKAHYKGKLKWIDKRS